MPRKQILSRVKVPALPRSLLADAALVAKYSTEEKETPRQRQHAPILRRATTTFLPKVASLSKLSRRTTANNQQRITRTREIKAKKKKKKKKSKEEKEEQTGGEDERRQRNGVRREGPAKEDATDGTESDAVSHVSVSDSCQ